MVKDDLGTRMKNFYENPAKTQLTRRTPVICRLDGRSFHTFAKGFVKPFCKVLMKSMQETMKYLCENVQGCVLGYTQSDEITLILVDYKNLNSSAWFDYEVQKLCSISASMATMRFNKEFEYNFDRWRYVTSSFDCRPNISSEQQELYRTYRKAINKGAMFDARCFNIPKEEVTNLILWRELDAIRNSVEMVGHTYYTPSELHGKTCEDIKNMLKTEKNFDWESLPLDCQRGACCIRRKESGILSREWIIDRDIPIFKGSDREYIDKLVFVGE
jgi:tRNA(His) 5'-end guanylyltransferase